MLKIAVTGKIASGKTTICSGLKDLGFKTVSCDDIVSEGQKPDNVLWNELQSVLSADFFNSDRTLDKVKVSDKLMDDGGFKKQLEDIVHPFVKKQLEQILHAFDDEGTEYCAAEVPLLFESGWENMFDKVILTYADADVRIARLESRPGISHNKAVKWVEFQKQSYNDAADITVNTNKEQINFKNLFEKIVRN